MNRLYSLFGTGDYKSCIYEMDGQRAQDTSFVQIAIVELLAKTEHPIDEVVVFSTAKAREPNETLLREELKRRGITIPFRVVQVVDTVTDQNIWELFEQVYDEIHEHDRVFFDITHGFRSFPFVIMPILHYARELKQINIGRILYGNFEAHTETSGGILAPIDDLTDLVSFLDWTHGVNTFLATGKAQKIVQLAEQEELKNYEAGLPGGFRSKQIALEMDKFNSSMETCRGVSFSEHAQRLRKNIATAIDDSVAYRKPLANLFQKVEEKMVCFTGDPILDPYYAVWWCIDHGLTQQAYTMLNEHVITTVCLLLEEDMSNTTTRRIVSSGISVASCKKPESDWEYDKDKPEEKQLMQRTVEVLRPYEEIFGKLHALRDYRNDMNHAGHRGDPTKPERFTQKIKEIAKALEPFFLASSETLQARAETAGS